MRKTSRMKELAITVIAVLTISVEQAAAAAGQDNYEQAPPAPLRYSLLDSRGNQHSERDFAHAKAAVFLFIATECPISNRYAPEVNRIVDDYSRKSFAFFAVHSDPDERAAQVKKHSQEFGYGFPALLDPQQILARRFGVVATPTAVVVSPAGEILYRGRIDNRYIDFGSYRDAGIESDLRLTLDSIAASKPVANRFTKVIGCALPPPPKDSVQRHSH